MGTEKQIIERQHYTGERPLFQAKNLMIADTVFGEGESPLKHSENIELIHTLFKWKYPLWYSRHISVKECTLFEMARAGIWYSEDITVVDTLIEAPKEFRRCNGLKIENYSSKNVEIIGGQLLRIVNGKFPAPVLKVLTQGLKHGLICFEVLAESSSGNVVR